MTAQEFMIAYRKMREEIVEMVKEEIQAAASINPDDRPDTIYNNVKRRLSEKHNITDENHDSIHNLAWLTLGLNNEQIEEIQKDMAIDTYEDSIISTIIENQMSPSRILTINDLEPYNPGSKIIHLDDL